MKKRIILSLLFMMLCLVSPTKYSAADTDFIIEGGSKTKWNNKNLILSGSVPFVANLNIDYSVGIRKFNFYYQENGADRLEEAIYSRIKLNGKDAFCINHDKAYGFNTLYKPMCEVKADYIKQLYKYGSLGNDENFFAQLFFWYLSSIGRIHCGDGNVNLTNYSTEGSTFSYQYYAAIADSKYLNVNYFNEGSCEKNFSNPSQLALCKAIKQQPSDKKFKYFIDRNPNQALKNDYKSKINNTVNGLGPRFLKISSMDVSDVPAIWIYEPETYANSAKAQNIVAPDPKTLDVTCTSVLGALKLRYGENIPETEKQKMKVWFGSIFNEKTLSCTDTKDECIKHYQVWQSVGLARNSRYNPKGPGSLYRRIWKLVKSGTVDLCGDDSCTTLYAELSSGKEIKYTNCDELYNKVSGVVKNSCKASNGKITSFECEPPDNGKKTCIELLSTAKAQGWSCDKLKNSITDSYLVECDETTKKPVSCQPTCEPKIEVDEQAATCKSKGKSKTFSLSDSTKISNTVDPVTKQECTSKNIGYNQKGKIAGSKDSTLSNSYCDVYCWESLSVILPTDPQSVPSNYVKPNSLIDAAKAGRLFFWGLDYDKGLFSEMNVKRICWTNPKYDVFAKDWNDNEDAITKAYAKYLAMLKYNANDSDDSVKQGDHCCVGNRTHNVTTGEQCFSTAAACQNYIHAVDGCAQKPEGSGNWCGGGSSLPVCDVDGHYYSKNEEESSATSASPARPTFTEKSGNKTSDCIADTDPKPSASSLKFSDAEIESAKNTVLKRISGSEGTTPSRNKLLTAIKSCQEPKETYYSNETQKYENALYRGKPATYLQRSIYPPYEKVELKTNGLEETTIDTTDTTKTRNYNCTVVGTEFGVGPCENNIITIKDFSGSEYEWNFNGYYRFYYTDAFRHWVIQPEGKVVEKEAYNETLKELEKNGLVYDIGIGFKTKMTTSWGFLHIKVNMANLGTCVDGKCTSFHFDKITKGVKTILDLDETKRKNEEEAKDGEELTYDCAVPFVNQITESECTYYIDNNGEMKPANSKLPKHCPKNTDVDGGDGPIDCTDCDLDIVYRLIDMGSGDNKKSKEEIKKDIFPGAEGKGRELGTNWESLYESGYEKFKYITTYDKIYDSTPIYSIDLTPSVITEIRKDNNNYRRSSNTGGSKDPYTSYYDADNKLKITCNTERGVNHTCVSDFITEYIQKDVIKGDLAKKDPTKRISYIKNYKCYYDTGKLDTACSNNIVY